MSYFFRKERKKHDTIRHQTPVELPDKRSGFFSLLVEAVEGAHFFSEPVDIPFIHNGDDFFSGAFGFSAQVSHGDFGRFVPEATECADLSGHSIKKIKR